MKVVSRLILILSIAAIFGSSTSAKPWRGIVPLHSTRKDVEKALGKPAAVDRDGFHYELDSEHVVFALAHKEDLEDCAQKLPADTVIRIAVTPKEALTIKDIGLPERSFIRANFFEPQANGFDVLINEEAGVAIRTLNGRVDRIVYFAEKNDQHMCSSHYMDPVLLDSRIICILCPTISVACSDNAEAGTMTSFTVNVTVGSPPPVLTYHWTVSAGTVLEGQGTDSIKVDTKNLAGKEVTATVKVGGIDPACSNTASCTTPITARKN